MSPWLIASGDFTTLGGMDRANHALARYLALSGRDVQLVAHRVSADLQALPGVEVRQVSRPFGSNLAAMPLLTRAAERAGRSAAGAVLLANGGNASWPATWLHYVHAVHTPVVASSMRRRVTAALAHRYYLAREARVLRSARRVICNSRRTADDAMVAGGVTASRLEVVYYGVDASVFGPVSAEERQRCRALLGLDASAPVALFAGALGDRRKGFDLLFEAWARLVRDAAWDVDLLVAGSGGEASAWRARADAAGLARRVRFLGFRRDIDDLISACDLVVHPARYEAYGLGVHEALCRGVPAIVTSSAGVAERYPKDLAPLLLTDPPGTGALVTALRAWRTAPDDWRERCAPLAARLRARSWDDMSAEMAALLENA